MNIRTSLEMMEIPLRLMMGESIVCPTLIWDANNVVLVDAGFPPQALREKMEPLGISFDRLNKVIITHQDLDHIGGLPGILNEAGQKIEVLAHSEEKPYIQGEKRSIKLTPERIAQIESMPEEQRRIMKAVYENPPKPPVDRTVNDGEELPYCGGIVVIHTPGHTPGHICLYHQPSKTLIAGDALNVYQGTLMGPNPKFTYDPALAVRSLQKLAAFDIQTIICYHGGAYRDHPNEKIKTLAEG